MRARVHAGGPGSCSLGTWRLRPNIDAVDYLLSEVFELIRSKIDCRLILAGIGAEALVEAVDVGGDDVELIGFCPDLKPCYDQCGCSSAASFCGGAAS